MDFNLIIIATIFIAIVGLIVGIFLGFSAIKFEVPINEKEVAIREVLPGANCGACGYPGCDGLANAIANGEARVNGCPVGGEDCSKKIGEIMGISSDFVRMVAFVKCDGDCNKASQKFDYSGIKDCNAAAIVSGGGPKNCNFGCMGLGSCVKACEYDAIHIINGIAYVDRDKCVCCECCVATCPKNLIKIVPYSADTLVRCNSTDKAKDVKSSCDVGCIGCKKCVKACEDDAVFVIDNLARIEYDKCINCGKCVEACPQNIIINKAENKFNIAV